MPRAAVPANIGTVELEYEVRGSAGDPPVLLVMGFTAQMITWPEHFVDALVARGLRVIRFDNRDCGLSSKLDGVEASPDAVMAAALTGQELPAVPYTLHDMADDAFGLLTHLGIEKAHIVGASMGGMIVQTMAIDHPERVLSMTSMMSMTGEFEFGSPTPEAGAVLLAPPPTERDAYIDASINYRVWQSRRYFDAELNRQQAALSYDRSFYPEGASRQLAAIYASGSRAEGLQNLMVPTLVVHGADDTLLPPDGGRRTADLIPNSTFLFVSDMGHDHPEPLTPLISGAIAEHVKLVEWQRASGR